MLPSLEVPGDTSPLAGAEHPKTGCSRGKSALSRFPLRSRPVAPSASKSNPKEKRLVWRKPGSNKGFFHFLPLAGFRFWQEGGSGSPPPQRGRLRNGGRPRDAPGEGDGPPARGTAGAPGGTLNPRTGREEHPCGMQSAGRAHPKDAGTTSSLPGSHSTPILTDPRGGVGASRGDSWLRWGGLCKGLEHHEAEHDSAAVCGAAGPGEASWGAGGAVGGVAPSQIPNGLAAGASSVTQP